MYEIEQRGKSEQKGKKTGEGDFIDQWWWNLWDGRKEISGGSWFMNEKRIEQKGRREKKRVWESGDGGGESVVEGEDESDTLIGMREKDE